MSALGWKDGDPHKAAETSVGRATRRPLRSGQNEESCKGSSVVAWNG